MGSLILPFALCIGVGVGLMWLSYRTPDERVIRENLGQQIINQKQEDMLFGVVLLVVGLVGLVISII